MEFLKQYIPNFFKRLALKPLKQLQYYYKFYKFYKFWKISDRRLMIRFIDRYPCVNDKGTTTSFDSHYLYHTAWAARKLVSLNPDVHVDFGSCLRFVSTVSAFIPIEFYDFRPPGIFLSNLNNTHADITELPFNDCSLNSISCMHVLEHIGLGRYGDPLCPDGDLKAASELVRVLSRSGNLLIVVPISGKPRIKFNAHRIYSFSMVKDMFAKLSLVEFSLIPDDAKTKGIIYNATKELADMQTYGCGCFHFIKE